MARWVRWNNPTIKPPFGAQIDWSNPITEGLIGCWLFNEFDSIPRNLVKSNPVTLNNVGWQGNGLYFSGNGWVDIDKFPEYAMTDFLYINMINVSAEQHFTYSGPAGENGFGSGGSEPSAGVCFDNPSTYKAFTEKSGTSLQIELTDSTLGKKKICYSWEANNILKLFVNKQKTSDSLNFTPSLDQQVSRLGRPGTDNRYFIGNFYFRYVWNVCLKDDIIIYLQTEPYSFFLYPQYWYLVDFGGINSIEYSSLYDILNKNEYNNKYDIQTKTEKNIKYDLLAQNTYVSKYDILTKKETNIGYEVLTKAEYSIIYDILSTKEYNSKYDLLNSLTTNILYNILTKNEYNVSYDILGTSAIEYTIKYDILNSAQTNIVFDILSKKEASIKYNILTNRTSNIVYDILAKTLTNIIYDILAKKETTFSYDIINKKEINFKYDILTAKLYTNIYNILTKSEYKILYDILSDIIIRPEVIFKLDKQDTIFKVGKINTIFKLK